MQIPFYYDYACPWAYLGSCRVEPYFADLGVEIDFRPVILAKLKEPTAAKGLELGERKKHNYIADLKHWAEMVGAEFSLRCLKRQGDRLPGKVRELEWVFPSQRVSYEIGLGSRGAGQHPLLG